MTRQTFYVSTATAEALNAAAARIQAATGGMVNKHEALSAIISAGVEQADSALSRLRAEKMRELGSADTPGVYEAPHTPVGHNSETRSQGVKGDVG